MDKIHDAGCQLTLGTLSIAVIQLADVKDLVAIGVGVVTVVCLLYTTFWKKELKRKERRGD